KVNTTQLVAQFKITHKNKYTYDETIYTSSNHKVKVRCPEDGIFEILPGHHRKGVGCRLCYHRSRKITLETFIARSVMKFGEAYSYSSVHNLDDPLIAIQCKRHNVKFTQDWRSHIKGHTGC